MGKNWRNTYNQYKSLFWKNYNYYKEKESFRNFIELFLTLTAIIILVLFALKPTITTIIDINKEIKAKEETIEKMNTKLKNLQRAQDILSQLQETVFLVNQALPSVPDPEIVLRQTEAASSESESIIKSISTNEVTLTGNQQAPVTEGLPQDASAFNLNLSLTGKYENLIKAIETYENMARMIIIKQLSLAQSSQEEETETLNLNLGIIAPYYGPKSENGNSNNSKNKEKEMGSTQHEENIIESSR